MNHEADERLVWVDGRVSEHMGVPRGAIFTPDANATKSLSDARAVAMVLLEALFYFENREQCAAFGCSKDAVSRAFKRVKADATLRTKAFELEEIQRDGRRQRAGRAAA
jgi:hypothetical protein